MTVGGIRAGWAAALWLGVLALAAPARAGDAPQACDAHYTPPHGPQRLTRTLTRDLSDGKQIIVGRSYRITFVHQAPGWRVEGEQVDVQVSSPPPLTALAALERARVDRETFPILLDKAGHILPGPAHTPPPAAPGNARAVDDVLAQAHMTPAQRATARAVSHAMLAPGANVPTPWPVDLFSAPPGTQEMVSHPALPDGTQGDVTMTLTAGHSPCARGGPARRQMQRDVVTRLGGTTRHTREVWTIEPESEAKTAP
jgi:hypothetical protein